MGDPFLRERMEVFLPFAHQALITCVCSVLRMLIHLIEVEIGGL